MFQTLRKKIQSLSETQQNILIIILINVFIIIFWVNFWFGLKKVAPPKIEEKPALEEEIPEALKPGEIGEISEAGIGKEEIQPIHPVIFNTSGTILEIKPDRLTVQGSGSNFADQKPRNLTLIFSDSTLTMKLGTKIKYQGLEGLKYLKSGMEILIEGNENIRGKTEFEARYIQIL